jgi:hypothetical protein
MGTVEEGAESEPGRNILAVGGDVLASLLLLISAIWLPWATYHSTALAVTFRGGRFGPVLVVCGAGSLGLVAVSLLWNRAAIHWLQLVLGSAAVLCSLVIALSKIADANQTASFVNGYSDTSYGIGAGLAIAASAVMVASSVAQLKSSKVSEWSRTDRTSEASTIR